MSARSSEFAAMIAAFVERRATELLDDTTEAPAITELADAIPAEFEMLAVLIERAVASHLSHIEYEARQRAIRAAVYYLLSSGERDRQ